MARVNNYLIQAAQAKQRFLTYDQNQIIAKFQLASDDDFLYITLLCKPYRIHRATGDLQYLDGTWQDGNSHREVLTLFDLLCDSREHRFLSGRWRNTQSFGHQFHQSLLEEPEDPMAKAIDESPDAFRAACLTLQAEPFPGGDMGYAIELFDGLKIGILFWHGDEEFAPRLRYLWDANATMYLRYETMYYAINLLERQLIHLMHTKEVNP